MVISYNRQTNQSFTVKYIHVEFRLQINLNVFMGYVKAYFLAIRPDRPGRFSRAWIRNKNDISAWIGL